MRGGGWRVGGGGGGMPEAGSQAVYSPVCAKLNVLSGYGMEGARDVIASEVGL